MSEPNSKTEVLDLDDDDLEVVEDDQIHWVKWTEPMTVDLEVTAYSPDGGRDIDQRPCPEVEGVLLRRAGDLSPGELARVTASQVKLARRLKKVDPKVGSRLVIKYLGLVKVTGGTMKDFEILRGKVPAPAKTRPSAEPPF